MKVDFWILFWIILRQGVTLEPMLASNSNSPPVYKTLFFKEICSICFIYLLEAHVWHGVHVEIRGQLLGGHCLLPPCGLLLGCLLPDDVSHGTKCE